MKTMTRHCLLLALAVLASILDAEDKPSVSANLALTPPMGWNSWNKFGCNVSEEMIKGMADAMVKSGMKDAGYQYVVIDDCWQVERDKAANIVADPKRFPSGIKALADYVHSLGLKFGIYSDAGSQTCAGRPGGLGHEYQDAIQYAAWGVDYLKYDWCHTSTQDAKAAYANIRSALDAAGRPIVLSICEWGSHQPWLWGAEVGGNLWRTTGDISPHWDRVYTILEQQAGLEGYAGPGHWNDPDMLEVGNGKLSMDENRAHFSMWAMLASPLLAGNDLPNMKPEIKAILTNRDVIALDQDSLGKQASRIYSEGEVEVWSKPLSGGAVAIAVLNAGDNRYSTHPFHLDLAKLGLHGSQQAKDLWTGKDVELTENMPLQIAGHDVFLVRVAQPK